jgi:hypothetical protein
MENMHMGWECHSAVQCVRDRHDISYPSGIFQFMSRLMQGFNSKHQKKKEKIFMTKKFLSLFPEHCGRTNIYMAFALFRYDE